jgi:hypothetical protein
VQEQFRQLNNIVLNTNPDGLSGDNHQPVTQLMKLWYPGGVQNAGQPFSFNHAIAANQNGFPSNGPLRQYGETGLPDMPSGTRPRHKLDFIQPDQRIQRPDTSVWVRRRQSAIAHYEQLCHAALASAFPIVLAEQPFEHSGLRIELSEPGMSELLGETGIADRNAVPAHRLDELHGLAATPCSTPGRSGQSGAIQKRA